MPAPWPDARWPAGSIRRVPPSSSWAVEPHAWPGHPTPCASARGTVTREVHPPSSAGAAHSPRAEPAGVLGACRHDRPGQRVLLDDGGSDMQAFRLQQLPVDGRRSVRTIRFDMRVDLEHDGAEGVPCGNIGQSAQHGGAWLPAVEPGLIEMADDEDRFLGGDERPPEDSIAKERSTNRGLASCRARFQPALSAMRYQRTAAWP